MLTFRAFLIHFGNKKEASPPTPLQGEASPPTPLQEERGVVCSRGHEEGNLGIGIAVGADFISVRSSERANVVRGP